MAVTHQFEVEICWTGNRGVGTRSYRAYTRSWDIAIAGKPVIHCSNDPMLGGDPSRHNPEDLLVAALSACHMLWYLHLCAEAGITVTDYRDRPVGFGETEPGGAGRFTRALLRPHVTVTDDSDTAKAAALHDEVHSYCFIARSVNFPVRHEPQILVCPPDHGVAPTASRTKSSRS